MSFSLLRRSFATRRLEHVSLRSARSYVRQRFSQLGLEALEVRALMAIDSSAAGAAVYSPLDVNQDGFIAPNDALLIINELNKAQASPAAASAVPMAASLPETMTPLLDVDGDGVVAASDAQLVINALDSEAVTTLMRIRLEVTDLNGNPITHVATGESFLLKGYVLDQRPQGNEGVFSAFADVTWASALASATGAINHGAYTTGPAGAASAGLLDEIGGTSGQFSPPLGPAEQLLFSVNFTAGPTAGNLQFVANPADLVSPDNPTHNSLLFNDPDHTIGGVPTNLIEYGSATLAVLTSDPVTASISPPDAPITEGNSGTTPAQFKIKLSAPSTHAITVNYVTLNDTALAPGDYTSVSNAVTFAPGETEKIVTINVTGDTRDEADSETFRVRILNANNDPNFSVPAAGEFATATINDDDLPPTMSIAAPTNFTEGNTGSNPATSTNFTVTLSAPSDREITVQYTTVPGTASEGDDFVATSGTLTFAPGETSKTISVNVIGDTTDESNENFQVRLSNPTNATFPTEPVGADIATATIVDDDVPVVSVTPTTVNEPATGTTDLTLTVKLNAASQKPITLTYATVDGTAANPGDYGSVSGTLVFAPGETEKTVVVTIKSDGVAEASESFTLHLESDDASISDVDEPITIIDADTPIISIEGPPQINEDAGTATYTVKLSKKSPLTVTVQATTTAGTATEDGDYTKFSGLITFAPNEDVQTFTVPINNDTTDENDETFTLTLSAPNANGQLSATQSSVTTTIVDNDDPPTISITPPTNITEGNTGTNVVNFTVTLSAASAKTVTVQYTTVPGTATDGSGGDFVATTGTLTFTPGQTSKTISVTVNGDTTDENDETFQVKLSNPTNATIPTDPAGADTATATILDNDAPPSFTVNPPTTFPEPETGTTQVTLTVKLNSASQKQVTLLYNTVDGTATSPADYESATGTLVFAPGELEKTVVVTIKADDLAEGSENFTLHLENQADSSKEFDAGITITDVDAPTVSIESPAPITEGTGTNNPLTFTVKLSKASLVPVSVTYTTAAGTASEDKDFGKVNNLLTFAPGETEKTFTVPIGTDSLNEDTETFTVTLSAPTNAVLSDNAQQRTATGTILDDDPQPTINISNPAPVNEGNTGTSLMKFTVTLSAASGKDVTVLYSTASGTATAGSDFTGVTNGTVTIPAGSLSADFTINILGDTAPEQSEAFTVTLANPTNAILGSSTTATGTILDDEAIVSVDPPAAVTEGTGADGVLNFVVKLSAPSTQTVTVNYTFGGGTATNGTDYKVANGTVTFAPGETSKTVPVTIVGDALNETNETFTMTLSSAVGATVSTENGTATGTITDDDAKPTVTIVPQATVAEGNTATTPMKFKVTLSAASGRDVTVHYSTTAGTATAGADFTGAADGTITIPAGQTSAEISIPVIGDTAIEPNETFTVTLLQATTNADLGAAITATGTIADDDILLSIAPQGTVTETPGGVTLNFVVTLSQASTNTVTVDYATGGGTATSGLDYTSTSGKLTFAPGETTKTISVPVTDDALNEISETLNVTLSNATNAGLDAAHTSAAGTINDNDPLPKVSIGTPAKIAEGNGNKTYNFPVTLSAASGQAVTIHYSTTSGTAIAGTDFTGVTDSTITIPAGQTTANIPITILGDSQVEPDESFTVTISNPQNATLDTTTTATGTIADDDALLTISDASVVEGNNGLVQMVFTVSLSSPQSVDVTVRVNSRDGTALADDDYRLTRNVLVTIPAGQTSATVSIDVGGDSFKEADETFTVELSGPTNASLGAKTIGTGTIINDDQKGVISGFAYVDTNNNGTKDPGERPLAGVMMQLVRTDNVGVPLSRTTLTAADGSYTFGDLDPGVYRVSETQPAGLADGKDVGYTGVVLTTGDSLSMTILGETRTNNNFGERGVEAPVISKRSFFAVNKTTIPTTPPSFAVSDATATINIANAATAAASGTGTPGAHVALVANDGTNTSIGYTTTVGADGKWSITGIDLSKLNDGTINYQLAASDNYGNTALINRTATKAAVAITAATEQINTTNVTNVSVSGTVQPGATVKVVASDDASTPHSVTATATVAANGTWTITGFDLSSLNDGPIQFVATATDAANNSVTAIRKVSKGTQ